MRASGPVAKGSGWAAVHGLPVAGGVLGLAPMPGVRGDYAQDFRHLLRWQPALVVSIVTAPELSAIAPRLARDLRHAPPAWAQVPVAAGEVPDGDVTRGWTTLELRVLARLGQGERVMFHGCDGCGRAAMIALRILIAAGEGRDAALARLRKAGAAADLTVGQQVWATR